MNRARGQFLTDPALAGDEYFRVRTRGVPKILVQRAHQFAASDEASGL
jgi:hypothetical protein